MGHFHLSQLCPGYLSLLSLQGRLHTSTAGALLQSGSVRPHSELPGCCQPREPAMVTHGQTDLTHTPTMAPGAPGPPSSTEAISDSPTTTGSARPR